jgi:GxxExxY protein
VARLLHPELSYKLVGILFNVFKNLGPGLQEKYYQKAIKLQLIESKIPFLEQVRVDLNIGEENVGRYYLDFIIDHKIVLEIKARSAFFRSDIFQVLGYLNKSGLELGILARFSQDGVKTKRILKGYP